MNILAIGAHSDDVEIGCGGTLLKYAALGHRITILTITDSEYTLPVNGFNRPASVAKNEAKQAVDMIGAELMFMDKPSLQLLHSEAFAHEFDVVIKEVKPDVVFTHWSKDIHSDHVAVSLSTIRAARHVGTIHLYRSNWYATDEEFKGTHYVNISDFMDRKLEMIKCYKSVLEPVKYSWINFIRRQNEYDGMRIGVEAAECFQCIKSVEW